MFLSKAIPAAPRQARPKSLTSASASTDTSQGGFSGRCGLAICRRPPAFRRRRERSSAVTRDYVFDLDAGAGQAPALSIFGGKITTFRRLAEHALEALRPGFPSGTGLDGRSETARRRLRAWRLRRFAKSVRERWPYLKTENAERLARAYGTRVERILGSARCAADLGRDFGCGLTQAELDYLARDEWARTADDVGCGGGRSSVCIYFPGTALAPIRDRKRRRLIFCDPG